MVNRGEEKVRVHMNVVPRSTGNTNGETEIKVIVKQMTHNETATDKESARRDLLHETKIVRTRGYVWNYFCFYCLALNHLIILGKYFLNVNALNTIMYKLDCFVSLVHKRINLGKICCSHL